MDYTQVLKVGDSVRDIMEGQGVGATTVAVTSGTQSLDMLANRRPTVILPGIAALPVYLDHHCYLGNEPQSF